MKFLIDTNIFIPLEPTTESDVEDNTLLATEFLKNILETGNQVYLHPAQKTDLSKDTDRQRKKIREIQFTKYPCLSDPPTTKNDLEDIIGKAKPQSNDWVDNQLIIALAANSVDYLVTEDSDIHKKSVRAGLDNRVVTLIEARSIVKDLFETTPAPPPAVKNIKAFHLNEKDPIFDSLREDYEGFDNWLTKCKQEHRKAWLIQVAGHDNYAGICIIKKATEEEVSQLELKGKVLKICTFKISGDFNGVRFGELLLKTVFNFSQSNQYDWLYLEIFKKYQFTIDFFNDFGFEDININTNRNEIRLAKPMTCKDKENIFLEPFEFHTRFGPFIFKVKDIDKYIVPIQPKFHKLLFPEGEKQSSIFQGEHPFGNSLRKAYLCHSNIRKMKKGSILLFYRSQDIQAVISTGLIEDTLVSSSPIEVARFVGKRTVYRFDEIEAMCQKEVLAILFRQIDNLKTPVTLSNLISNEIIKAAPQSITQIEERSESWLENQIQP